jgi:hypothetical protein
MVRRLFFITLVCASLKAAAQQLPQLETEEPVKALYKMDLMRAAQGTLQISREGRLNNNTNWQIGVMGTYATTRGLAKPYLRAQDFSYLDAATNIRYSLYDVEAKGFGLNLQLKKYLGPRPEVFKGFYSGPEFFVRYLNLVSPYFDRITQEQKEISRNLYLGYAGYMTGYQVFIRDVIALDLYLGGGFFYSQYENAAGPTRFRSNYQVDYTGIYLNAGLLIGIVN